MYNISFIKQKCQDHQKQLLQLRAKDAFQEYVVLLLDAISSELAVSDNVIGWIKLQYDSDGSCIKSHYVPWNGREKKEDSLNIVTILQ